MSYQDTYGQGVRMLVKQEDEPRDSSDEEIDMNVVPVEDQPLKAALDISDCSKSDQVSKPDSLVVATVSHSPTTDKAKLGLFQKSLNSVRNLNYDVQDLKQSLQELKSSTSCQETKLDTRDTFLPRLVSRLETDITRFLNAIEIFVHLGPSSSSSRLSDGTSSPEHTEDWYQTIENMDVAPLLPPPPPLPPMYHLYRSAFEYDKESIVNTSPLPGVDSDSEDEDVDVKTTRTPFVRSPASISETSSDIEGDSDCESDCTECKFSDTECTSHNRHNTRRHHNVHKKHTSVDMDIGISSDSETDAVGVGAGGGMLRYNVSVPTKRPRSSFIQGKSNSKINHNNNTDNRKRRGKFLGDISKPRRRVEPGTESRASSKSRKQPMFGVPKALETRDNDDICGFCLIGGDLLCCDGRCFRSFHLECLGLTSLPEEDHWVCPDCKKLPEDRYIVEKVLKTAVRNGVRQFFVKWKGYPDSKNSWALDVSPELIAIFEASKSKNGNKKRKRHNTSEAPSKKKKTKSKKDRASTSAAAGTQEEAEDVWIINTPSGEKWRWVGRNRAHAKTGLSVPIKTDLSAPIKTDISAPIKTDISAPIKTDISLPIKTEISLPTNIDISLPIKTDISVPTNIDVSVPIKAETVFVAAPVIDAAIQTTVVDDLAVSPVQQPVRIDLSVVATVSYRSSPTVIDLCEDDDVDVVVTIDSSPESTCRVNTVITV